MELRESPKILIHQLLFFIRYLSVNSLKAFLVSKGPFPHFKFIRLIYSVLKQGRSHGTKSSRDKDKNRNENEFGSNTERLSLLHALLISYYHEISFKFEFQLSVA